MSEASKFSESPRVARRLVESVDRGEVALDDLIKERERLSGIPSTGEEDDKHFDGLNNAVLYLQLRQRRQL